MKVSATSGASGAAASKAPARASGGGFSLGETASASAADPVAPTHAMTGVASIDALLALQSVGSPLERKKRAVKRAGRLLDVLDEIKIGMLDGVIPGGALGKLVTAIRDQREETDDPRLESVLNDIETRAAVELAKLEVQQQAA